MSAPPHIEKTMPIARAVWSGWQTSLIATFETMKVLFMRPWHSRSVTLHQKSSDAPKATEITATDSIEIRSGSWRPNLSEKSPQGMPLRVEPRIAALLR